MKPVIILVFLILLSGCFGTLKITPESEEVVGKCLQTKHDYLIIYQGTDSHDGKLAEWIYGDKILDAYLVEDLSIGASNFCFWCFDSAKPEFVSVPLINIPEFKANKTQWQETMEKKCTQLGSEDFQENCMENMENLSIRDIELLPKGTKILITEWHGS